MVAAFALTGTSASAASLTRGFVDSVWFDDPADGISIAHWIANTQSTGARFVQVEVDWTGVEPRSPLQGANLTSSSAPQFDFSSLDGEVEALRGTGLQPVFLITDAPRWAEGSGGTPSEYATGGYKPNAAAFGDLGEALAKRYSGHTPVPWNHRLKLPRVRYLQAWAEANMSLHLSPQWSRIGGRVVNTGANIYRGMLNAFYAGVKAGDRGDVVLTSGLEGYGDAPFTGNNRTHPVTFLENLLCLNRNLKRAGCAGAHFDVMASDPYDAYAPTTHAVSKLDASAPDLGRLMRVVQAGLAAHTLLPDRHKALWVTEFGYDSDPPNPTSGVPHLATQARWLEQSFYVFWDEGVSTVMWYLIRDQTPPYDENYFSGVYFRDGKPKPSLTAYRFPFVVAHRGRSAQIWGISPTSGSLRVQQRARSGWVTIATFRATAGRVFTRSDQLPSGTYRATVRGQRSLAWSYVQSRPHKRHRRPPSQPPSITFSG